MLFRRALRSGASAWSTAIRNDASSSRRARAGNSGASESRARRETPPRPVASASASPESGQAILLDDPAHRRSRYRDQRRDERVAVKARALEFAREQRERLEPCGAGAPGARECLERARVAQEMRTHAMHPAGDALVPARAGGDLEREPAHHRLEHRVHQIVAILDVAVERHRHRAHKLRDARHRELIRGVIGEDLECGVDDLRAREAARATAPADGGLGSASGSGQSRLRGSE